MPLHSSLIWILSSAKNSALLSLLLTTAIGSSILPAIAQASSLSASTLPASGSTDAGSTYKVAQANQPKPMTTIAEEFMNLTAQGDFVGASQYLDPTFRQTWLPADMQQSWENLQQRAGAFRQVLSFEQADASIVLANTQFENLTDDLVIIFDDSRQWIVGVDFPEQ
ncbi:MAG: DUF3887 domain-containing protein [Leptolyngbyaceae cyanobacterium CRU_2_3]|nr:DUF3887 domain-containing protein [Leptolyngbyaceae cyanobacterium CRU_2_3]